MTASLVPFVIFGVLPGWPEPAHPITGLHLVLLCVIGPLAFGALVAAIAFAPSLRARGHDEARESGLVEQEPSAERQLEAPLSGSNPDGSARRQA
jgi:hypothetical protein